MDTQQNEFLDITSPLILRFLTNKAFAYITQIAYNGFIQKIKEMKTYEELKNNHVLKCKNILKDLEKESENVSKN